MPTSVTMAPLAPRWRASRALSSAASSRTRVSAYSGSAEAWITRSATALESGPRCERSTSSRKMRKLSSSIGWTRLNPPPTELPHKLRRGRPRRTRRTPCSGLRGRSAARGSPSVQALSLSPGRSLCTPHSPRRRSLRRRPSSPQVPPGGDHPTRQDHGQHVYVFRLERAEIGQGYLLRGAVGVLDDAHWGIGGAVL